MIHMNDPHWYKDIIIYEVHVRSFMDSTLDGMGDFPGLTQKLDYLQDLGITAVWLLPFYPSPLKDDGYDIAAYRDINPSYGSLRDFRHFVREAHSRGIRVITELVLNHTSDQHRWFKAARMAPHGSPKRNFYVWSDTDQKYQGARIIFTDFEKSNWTWDPVAKAYYWHRFFHHQPDLNFDNPAVLKEVTRVLKFWLDMGVDGLRLDAVPYLVEREGTNCENLADTHQILKRIRKEIDANYDNRMLLAEANQWPADVRPYFGAGDECHMAFHFPLMPRMFMALRQEDRHPITDILRQTPEIPESCQWSLFLRNHDELTLEMVTDEERDYMYNAYAADPRMRINIGIRRRLAPLMDNSRRRIELLNSLLFSFHGTPIIYYGDEIGMGDNIYLGDREGVRTPMQWNSDRNGGFSRADFAMLSLPPIMDPVYGYQSINVEAQQRDPSSLLNWMKRMIALRSRFRKVFGRGSFEFVYPSNRKILSYVRKYEDQTILCVANLSRFVQPVELDLSAFQGMVPVEIFGSNEFPKIKNDPYFLTVGPHSFYWFNLVPKTQPILLQKVRVTVEQVESVPMMILKKGADDLLKASSIKRLEQEVIPAFLPHQRWFGGKARPLQSVHVIDVAKLPGANHPTMLFLLKVRFRKEPYELYVLPLAIVSGEQLDGLWKTCSDCIIARLKSAGVDALLIDAMADDATARLLLETIRGERKFSSRKAALQGLQFHKFDVNPKTAKIDRNPGEQSNTSLTFDDRVILKLFRRMEQGPNPEYEILHFLTTKTHFDRVPRLLGAIEYRSPNDGASGLAVLQNFVTNQGDAWRYTQEELKRYLERILSQKPPAPESTNFFDLIGQKPPARIADQIGIYLSVAAILGRRTAELHLALASDTRDPAFAPEPATHKDIAALGERLREHGMRALQTLENTRPKLSGRMADQAEEVLLRAPQLLESFAALQTIQGSISAIRVHGDYHLGQLLWAQNDFVVLDFEGEPARTLQERRRKQFAVKDIAGMLRSFSYAVHAADFNFTPRPAEDSDGFELWMQIWQLWSSVAFLEAYLNRANGAVFLPQDPNDFRILLSVFMIDKGLYELEYELNNRPQWAHIPLSGILDLTRPLTANSPT